MALLSGNSSNWFEKWEPPPIYPDLHTGVNSKFRYPYRSTYHESEPRMDNFLPYLLTLGLIQPKSFQQSYQSSIYSNSKSKSTSTHDEITGPFKTVYHWNFLDFEFPSEETRIHAINTEDYIQKNNLPLGIDVWKDKIFLSMPKWKPGVPATLAWLPKKPVHPENVKLKPYPNWDWHKTESCNGITSVFRMQVDHCDRLWVLDSGQIDITTDPKQICHPQILIFDLRTDRLLKRHVFKHEYIKEDSLYSNILVDIRDNDCDNVHAYVTDVWRFGLVVYSLRRDRSWRITNHLFFPDPLAAAYKVHDLEFSWTDGLFGLALSPYDPVLEDRILYFHPMSSFRQFYVKTSVVCNETGWEDAPEEYKLLGQSRGKSGHVSASAMDRNGILYFNYVTRDSIGCWDSRKSYRRSNLGLIAQNHTTLVFPNDLRLDKEKRQGIWIVTNRLPFYLYKGLNEYDINFRVMHAYTDEAIRNTICDPNVSRDDSYRDYSHDLDCY